MRIHEIAGYMQSIFLVEYADKLLLLDGGSRVDVPKIQHFIEHTLNKNMSDLKLVVVTHVHPDHAGGVAGLKKISQCQVAMASNTSFWYFGATSIFNYFVDILLAHFVAYKSKKPFRCLFYNPFIRPDVYLKHEENLPGFDDWLAYNTPGHTDRDLTLYHGKEKIAYTADLIIKTRKGFISPYPIYFPKHYTASLQTIQSLALDSVLLAHGGRVQYQAIDFSTMFNKIPKKPLTNANTLLKKIKQLL